MMKIMIATYVQKKKIILYSTTDRNGYRIYKSKRSLCQNCPSLERCTKSKRKQKTIERCFGTAKEYHGFRYTNMKGLAKMRMKSALTFACMNMKKLANILWNMDPNRVFFIAYKALV